MVVETIAIDRLPCAPQVLLEVLELLQGDAAMAEIAAAAGQDAVITGRILAAAAALKAPVADVEQALAALGREQLHALIFSVGIRQCFTPLAPASAIATHLPLWRGSLRHARLAGQLAALTGYSRPDEAHLAGLLANLGERVLLDEFGAPYQRLQRTPLGGGERAASERQRFGSDYCAIGADLVGRWRLGGFIADAIRYQHEGIEQLQDAYQLVRLVHCAGLMAAADVLPQAAIDAAARFFGLAEADLRALHERQAVDCERRYQRLQLQSPEACGEAGEGLAGLLGELSELEQMRGGLLLADTAEELIAVVQRWLALAFGISPALLFLYDETGRQLTSLGAGGGDNADFKLRPQPGRSLVGDVFLQNQPLDRREDPQMPVIDRQLLHFFAGEVLVGWPLTQGREGVLGVVVFAITRGQLAAFRDRRHLITGLFRLAAQALAAVRQKARQGGEGQAVAALYTQRIREAVHEANNPLSIIRNYLETLRLRLGAEHEADESLGVIGEEIIRVGDILRNLASPADAGAPQAAVDVNRIVADTTRIIDAAVFSTKNITVQLDLDSDNTVIEGSAGQLKQILTNLLKNAAEALDANGRIVVTTDATISFDGRDFVGITVVDNGPGIPDAIRERLFQAGGTSKGGDHAGLGLSIVKKLVDSMRGHIICSSSAAGTEFRILLPRQRSPRRSGV